MWYHMLCECHLNQHYACQTSCPDAAQADTKDVLLLDCGYLKAESSSDSSRIKHMTKQNTPTHCGMFARDITLLSPAGAWKRKCQMCCAAWTRPWCACATGEATELPVKGSHRIGTSGCARLHSGHYTRPCPYTLRVTP